MQTSPDKIKTHLYVSYMLLTLSPPKHWNDISHRYNQSISQQRGANLQRCCHSPEVIKEYRLDPWGKIWFIYSLPHKTLHSDIFAAPLSPIRMRSDSLILENSYKKKEGNVLSIFQFTYGLWPCPSQLRGNWLDKPFTEEQKARAFWKGH